MYSIDRNRNLLRPGSRVRFQISPRLPWVTGTVIDEGKIVRDYNGTKYVLEPAYTERLSP